MRLYWIRLFYACAAGTFILTCSYLYLLEDQRMSGSGAPVRIGSTGLGLQRIVAYAENFLHRVKIHSCPGLRDGPVNVTVQNLVWQRVTDKYLYLFSAYYDARLGPKRRVVRVIASSLGKLDGGKFYCQLRFKSPTIPDILVVDAEATLIWSKIWDKDSTQLYYWPYLFSCPVPTSMGQNVPYGVSLVSSPCSASKNLLKLSPPSSAPKQDFAVCVKGLDFRQDFSQRLVEWIELQILLGAKIIDFYVYLAHQNVLSVLEYYQKAGKVRVLELTLPGRQPNEPHSRSRYIKRNTWQKRRNELVPYNDCFYRHIHSHHFVVLLDLDEAIVPLRHDTWQDLIGYAVSQQPDALFRFASIAVQNVYFFDEFPTEKDTNLPRGIHMLSHVTRSANFSKPGFAVKSFLLTNQTLTAFNHYALAPLQARVQRSILLSRSMAQMHHYREKCPPHMDLECERNFLRFRVRDTAVWRWKRKLAERVEFLTRPYGKSPRVLQVYRHRYTIFTLKPNKEVLTAAIRNLDVMDTMEKLRRLKRILENYISTKRAFLLVTVIFGLLLYLGPSVFRWLRQKTPIIIDPNASCVSQYLDPMYRESLKFDASLSKSYDFSEETFLPYIGNGHLGLPFRGESSIFIMHKRSLSLPIDFYPIVQVDLPGANSQEGIAIHYTSGVAYKFQCFSQRRFTVEVREEFFAQKVTPSLLVQDLRVRNPLNEPLTVTLKQTGTLHSVGVQTQIISMGATQDYQLITFRVNVPESSKIIAIAIATPVIPSSLTVDSKSTKSLKIVTSVQYSEPIDIEQFARVIEVLKNQAKQDIGISIKTSGSLKTSHVLVWKKLWTTGFGISLSKAQGAINGDKINATLYYVLSNSRSYLNEEAFSASQKEELQSLLAYSDQCYGGPHTLQASKLWSHLSDITDVNRVVSLWMLTLEKQGCKKLLTAGAEGVVQAMVLSFGGLKFSEQHLEFNGRPKDLHRDYFFRRLSYGNATHLNISVVVGEDNKAIISVALDRSDRDYYGCDAGCLDPPVKLGSQELLFPVKLTEPVTAILYITSDKQHMEQLKHTIHVQEVVEAPAHEHHIIALHRHGHQLGGLPALFWVSIAFLIVVFHLFLAKLIYNEYCAGADKSRGRYIV